MTNVSTFFEALERLGILDQHTSGGALADADHDGHRRREAERARAGNDDDRNRGSQSGSEGRAGRPDRPGGEGRNRHQDDGDPVPPARSTDLDQGAR
jgi:hypothetical protein